MKKLIALLLVLAVGFAAQADLDGYFMLSLISPGELPVPDSSINGGRLSLIYGNCKSINGLDVGLVGHTREYQNGLAVNVIYNLVGTDFNGLQIGCVNFDENEFAGLQLGLGNVAFKAAGCQVGIYNYAETLSGCQIGLLNTISSQRCHTLPILNIGW